MIHNYSLTPYDDGFLENSIKALADDELLDIWEETQSEDSFYKNDWGETGLPRSFEQVIISELQYRNCRRQRIGRIKAVRF